MKDVNKVILVGRLGAEPILRETKNGIPVAQFPLATSRWLQPKSPESKTSEVDSEVEPDLDGVVGETASDPSVTENHGITQWHRVVTWGRQGQACAQYLKKGQAVYVEGTLRSRHYDGEDGLRRTVFEVHANHVSFLGWGGQTRSENKIEAQTLM